MQEGGVADGAINDAEAALGGADADLEQDQK
jgi:hypothetical protein